MQSNDPSRLLFQSPLKENLLSLITMFIVSKSFFSLSLKDNLIIFLRREFIEFGKNTEKLFTVNGINRYMNVI